MYLYLEDGSIFQGRGITSCRDAVGLVSYYTGVVGYQELITDPANQAKILLFTYPEIGNYGVNSEDAESNAPKASGVIAKEYCQYYSNFRAEGSLKDYLDNASVPLLDGVDTRAVLLALREKGEMWGVITSDTLSTAECGVRITNYREKLASQKTQGRAEGLQGAETRVKAAVVDFGASKSFYKTLAARGIAVTQDEADADMVVVAPLPFYVVEDAGAAAVVKSYIGKKSVVGFGDGAALVAAACGIKPKWMGFGHHGVNLPVRFQPTGRREITVQNHHFIVEEDGGTEVIFENMNDKTPEGFRIKGEKVLGVSFVPDAVWFEDVLKSLEVV